MSGSERGVLDLDRDGVSRIGRCIDTAQAEFSKLAKELEGQLADMHRDWVGEGGSAFGQLMVEWQRRQDTITRLLQQFEDSLTQTQRTSTEQDSSQASSMFAMNRALNS